MTRLGIYGLKYKGIYYMNPANFDDRLQSVTSLLQEVRQAHQNGLLESWKDKVEKLIYVTDKDPLPNDEEINRLGPYTDLINLSNKLTREEIWNDIRVHKPNWYRKKEPTDQDNEDFIKLSNPTNKPTWRRLLWKCYGSFDKIFDSGYIQIKADIWIGVQTVFYKEYAFILNLDDETVEMYDAELYEDDYDCCCIDYKDTNRVDINDTNGFYKEIKISDII